MYAKTKAQITCTVSVVVFEPYIEQSLLPKCGISRLTIFCGCTVWLGSDLVGNHEDMFSHDMAHIPWPEFFFVQKNRLSYMYKAKSLDNEI